jgi:hypothetical protein
MLDQGNNVMQSLATGCQSTRLRQSCGILKMLNNAAKRNTRMNSCATLEQGSLRASVEAWGLQEIHISKYGIQVTGGVSKTRNGK